MRRLGKDIAIYGISNMVYSLVQFVVMPLVVKSMSMEEISYWNILLPTAILLASITTFGMDSSVVRYLADTNSPTEHRSIFSAGFFTILLLATVIGIFLYYFTPFAMDSLHLPRHQSDSYWLMIAWFIGLVINQYCLNWFKFTFKRSTFITLMFLQSIVYLVIILLLKHFDILSVSNVMLALGVSQWLNVLICIVLNRNMFTFNFRKQLLRELMRYGLPSMMIVFGMNLLLNLDRYILTGQISKEDFAIYTQAFRICAIMSMFVSSFNFAFSPSSLSIINDDDAGAQFSKIHSYYLLIMTFFGLGFIACGKLAILLLSGAEYLPAFRYFPFIVFAFILYGLYTFAQIGIIKSKKIFFALYVVVAGIILTFVIDMVFVRSLGGFGCVIGLLVALLSMLLLANIISKRNLFIPYAYAKDLTIVSYFLGLATLFCYLDISKNIYWDSTFKCAILFVSILPLISILFKDDKTKALAILWRKLKPAKPE